MSIDLGRLDDKYFINFCSVGLDALIAEEANKIKDISQALIRMS